MWRKGIPEIINSMEQSLIIPLLTKLQLREVAGAGLLIAPERNLHFDEDFAGIDGLLIH